MEERHIYKVSELNREIKNLLEGEFPEIWLEGEVSNFKLHTSGHMYFSLKDADAQISAVIYRNIAEYLKFKPEDGLKIICRGKISTFIKRGQYQIVIYYLEPAGKGALQVAFEQLKKKLQAQGLFDEEGHKIGARPIPVLPQKIGVVTSPTGAAIRDILQVISRRFANVEILISPTRVQGDEAAGEIVEALGLLNKYFPELDVIIVARGGGSLEDLWPFNEEKVAKAVYESRIPTISGVGHEIDWTICDMVADCRAPTPSAAAELVVQSKEEMEEKISNIKMRLQTGILRQMENYRNRYERIKQSVVFKRPQELIAQWQQQVDDFIQALKNTLPLHLEKAKRILAVQQGKLSVLSPLAVLQRGYSITYKLPEEEILKAASRVRPEEEVRIKLARGTLLGRILKIFKE